MFAKHLQMQVDDNETLVIMACHPKAVKEIFLAETASYDYELHVCIDGKELKFLNPKVIYDGYFTLFYFEDSVEVKVGSRIEITLTFWYKDKMVRYFNGSENIRRDEMAQATEHWTYEADEQFHIDPEDVDPSGFLEMLKPEWRNKNGHVVESTYEEDNIIDVDFTEVKEEEEKCSQEKIKQIEMHT